MKSSSSSSSSSRPAAVFGLVVFVAELLASGASSSAWAQDEVRPLVVALYAPTAPLANAEARFAYVEKLAQQLSAAGVPAQGKVFARSGDLEGAIRHGQVDLAVLDAIYLAERGLNYPVLAATTVSGESALRWGLYTSLPQGNLGSLAGKRLSWAQTAGKEPTFLDNALLEGELKVAEHFDLRPPAPDIAAAVSEVVLRHADCVFAPDVAVAGKGLRRVFDAGKVQNPALVQVQQRLPRDVVIRAQRVLLSATGLGGLDGFRQVPAEPYRQLRQRILNRASGRRLVMAEPQPLLSAVNSGMLAKDEFAPDLLPLRALLLVPSGVP